MRCLISLLLIFTGILVKAEGPHVDHNFFIYICFGQSNMEGYARPTAEDFDYVDPRFQMLACVDFTDPIRDKGEWYVAYPPLVRQTTGISLVDYFGRTMVKSLPDYVKVGVVVIGIGGIQIEGFISEELEAYLKNQPDWLRNYVAKYDNDPYACLVEMSRKAQKSGVIKGILLHQGENNYAQEDWPNKVKMVYDRLIGDLNLNPEDVPLLVGELVSKDEGGACWRHNKIIATIPNIIPTSYVITSEDCPQLGDGLHFSREGCKVMGERFAKGALKALDVKTRIERPVLYEIKGDFQRWAYDLSGQRVNKALNKGRIYMKGSKKFIVK